jgi:hypothetical protein
MYEKFNTPVPPQNTEKQMKFTNNIFIFILISIVTLIVIGFFGYKYISPYGAQVIYKFTESDKDKLSKLNGAEPSENIDLNATNALTIPEQTIRTNIVTFNLKLLSNKIEGVWVNLKYKGNPKEIKIGVKGNTKEVYQYKPLYNEVLETLNNPLIINDIIFWQKVKKYNSFQDFTNNIPKDKTTAIYFFNTSDIYQETYPDLGNFTFNKLLRGSHQLLISVNKLPLTVTISKQDQNMYKGEDPLTIEVYRDSELLDTKKIPDDGITNASNLRMQPQEAKIELKNIKPGIYKLVLSDKSTGGDVRISSITINQKKVIFNSPIYVVDNKPTTLITNAPNITAITYHEEGLQNLKINENRIFEIKKIGETNEINLTDQVLNQNSSTKSTILNQKISEIYIPKNDLYIKGDGYFSFDKNSFFNPNPLNSIDLSALIDISNIDYIIAKYQKVKKDGDWNITQAFFDPKDINVIGDKLFFTLESPGLKQNNAEIIINNLEVTVNKPGLFGNKTIISNEKLNISKLNNNNFLINIWTNISNFLLKLWQYNSNNYQKTKLTENELIEPINTSITSPTPILPSEKIPTPTPNYKERIYISVQNGGRVSGTAAKYADILKKAGFKNVESKNASNLMINNATISINKDDKIDLESTISEIKEILRIDYDIFNENYDTVKGKIEIILGSIPKSTSTTSPTPTIIP